MKVRIAERKKAKARIGIAGPSGSGKSLSSLFIAYGLVGDWSKIGMIDTENKKGDLYAETEKCDLHIGQFLKVDISAPFSPDKYIQAIELLEEAGAECIIIDSISHEWAGVGGILDIHSETAKRTGNSFTAWKEVNPLHNRLVDKILGSTSHIIATLRTKTEYVILNDGNKAIPKKLGLAPIQRDGIEYEFSIFMEIDQDHLVRATNDMSSLFGGREFTPTVEDGRRLLEWLNTGKDVKPKFDKISDGLLECKIIDIEADVKNDKPYFIVTLQQDDKKTQMFAIDKCYEKISTLPDIKSGSSVAVSYRRDGRAFMIDDIELVS